MPSRVSNFVACGPWIFREVWVTDFAGVLMGKAAQSAAFLVGVINWKLAFAGI